MKKIYSLKDLKGNVRFYYGTGRLYLTETNSQTVAICKARKESLSGQSVNIYVESDNAPLQMVRAYKDGQLEYVAEKIQTK